MKIYLDDTFKCHTSNPDGVYQEFETKYFDGKCSTFIEGYRFVPEGEKWKDTDGISILGEMVAPWKPYEELDAAQREYERQKLADAENALAIMWGGVTV